MPATDQIAQKVIAVITETLHAKGKTDTDVSLDSPVDRRLGLDSLDWATVVVRLEEETGVDPFQEGLSRELNTIADLVELYAAAAG
ncbi:MAG: hypothetical protein JSV80_06820 [Acidobacteriota bacterium]|nr:MAG: hypothetical protein JSV80_06820 [Acidobacteriota bacterium]